MAAHDEKRDDPMLTILIWIGLICGIGFLAWWKMRAPVVMVAYSIMWIQYKILYYIFLLGPMGQQYMAYVQNVLLHHINPGNITFEEFANTEIDCGSRTFIFWIPPILYYTYIVNRDMLGNGCKRVFGLKGNPKKGVISFIKYQSTIWKTTKIVVNFNPEKTDIEKYGRPLRIMEYLEKHNVIVKNGRPDTAKLEPLFIKQLGPRWVGFHDSPFYVKALLSLAMVSLQHYKRIDAYRNKICDIMTLDTDEEIREAFEKILEEEISNDPRLVPEIERIAAGHAYTNVACLAVLGHCGPFKAWTGGQGQILCPAMYQWMMRFDRTLYMVLQGHGRHAFFIEGVAAVSHYQLERAKNTSYNQPFVSTAIEGVVEALKRLRIVDTDTFHEEVSKINKRYTN